MAAQLCGRQYKYMGDVLIGIPFRYGKIIYPLLQNVQTELHGPPNPSNGYGGIFLGGFAAGS
jgi:hypothetical protein